ncbi:hypothetical protein KCP69_23540 [Salmonella enterica subsp. enterica]|nr:hypothetical protein KCP69_23540 [Salmonella enterica subsp. enterica]
MAGQKAQVQRMGCGWATTQRLADGGARGNGSALSARCAGAADGHHAAGRAAPDTSLYYGSGHLLRTALDEAQSGGSTGATLLIVNF